MASERPGLTISGVTVRFGGVTAIDDVCLAVPPATVTGLVGPDGAGKTTLLDVAAGRRRPSRGTVLLDGVPAESGVARTFQEPPAPRGRTVREHVLSATRARMARRPGCGRTPADRWRWRRDARRGAEETADALLDRVGIAEHAHAPTRTLPPGPAQLLQLAKALAAEPRALLLDQPSAGLSVAESRALEVLLRELAAEGLAVLLAEHDLEAVIGVCDVLYALSSGKVIASGPPVEVRGHPRVRTETRASPVE
ncbi:ATP-binding cassette domain-containing protein [Spirillospora sp. CA-294931]|uniref:ATP-binding cassette domain-containing protein n=1 Tax=Spirillospora sp. CA-294931 TaxID=3240042 RepID=UPI003D934675